MHQFCSEMAKQNTRKNKRKEKLVSILSGKLFKKKMKKKDCNSRNILLKLQSKLSLLVSSWDHVLRASNQHCKGEQFFMTVIKIVVNCPTTHIP